MPNRRGLFETIEREIARAGRQGSALCLYSAGIARRRPEENGDELLRRADDTMYEAKSAGDQTVLQAVSLPAA